MFLSPSLHKEHLRIRALHSFAPSLSYSGLANFSVEVKHDAVSKIQSLFGELKAFVA